MVMFEIHSHPVLQKYKAHLCSRASVFQLFVVLITFLFPLLIAYVSQGIVVCCILKYILQIL